MEKLNTNLSLGYRKCCFIIKVFSIFFSFTFSNLLFATNYYVNDNSTVGDVFTTAVGDNANNGTDPSTPKLTLTNLLTTYAGSLAAGDVIYVDAGTYDDDNLTINIVGITIQGAGPALTVFDNAGASADANMLFTINSNDVIIEHIHIKGYNKGTGGASAILITDGVSGVIFNNVLTDENLAGGGSATILVNGGSSVTFNGGGSNCNAVSSVAGGGVNVEGNNNLVVFNDYSFSSNSKDFQGGSGLYIVGTDASTLVTVNSSIFADNINGTTTGGAAILVGGASLNVSNSCFSNNSVTASGHGGAISVKRGATVNIDNSTFTNNSVTASGHGGAIAIFPSNPGDGGNSTVNLTSCTFSGNTANEGNHLYTNDNFSRDGFFNVTECTFIEPGSGVSVESDDANSTITIENSGNPSKLGAGVIFTNTTAPSTTASTSCPILQGTCYGVILPIELTLFRAYCANRNINITWQTASEKNNDYFLLERSKNGYDFERVVIIQGAGNTQLEQEYQFSDYDFLPGTSYYRLTQVDFNGRSETFDIISVQNDCVDDENLRAHYNKEAGTIRLFHQFEEQDILSLAVYSVSGQRVPVTHDNWDKNLGYSEIIPFTEFAKGIYIITLQTLSEVKTAKIIIQ